ncbi:hypothetical protein QCF01_15210, partial [Staphylococcus aureus]|nr:hypothetical protein [Staphylococcus aureus]
WDKLVERVASVIPRNHIGTISALARESNEVLGAFIRGQFLVMLALGVIYAGGLSLVGLKLGLLIGLVATVMVGRALQARRDPFPDSLMQVMQRQAQLLQQAQVGPVVPPTLVSHTHTPRARRIAENLGRRVLYVGITAVLAVPVWFATRGHFDGSATPSPNTASLDAIPAAVPVAPSAAGVEPAAPAEVASAPASKPAATPYVASLSPVPRSAPAAPAAANTLEMQFSGDSWVD